MEWEVGDGINLIYKENLAFLANVFMVGNTVYVSECSMKNVCIFIYYKELAHVILGASLPEICRAGGQPVNSPS